MDDASLLPLLLSACPLLALTVLLLVLRHSTDRIAVTADILTCLVLLIVPPLGLLIAAGLFLSRRTRTAASPRSEDNSGVEGPGPSHTRRENAIEPRRGVVGRA